MATLDIAVPDIGDFDEVTVIELLVKAGDTIKADQSLLTVESDKASMESPSSAAGVVKEVKVKLGDKVKQGSVVLSLESSDSAPVSAPKAAEAESQDAFKIVVPVKNVVAPVSVLDKAGSFVVGLKPESFELYDNGKKQEITLDVVYEPLSLVIAEIGRAHV